MCHGHFLLWLIHLDFCSPLWSSISVVSATWAIRACFSSPSLSSEERYRACLLRLTLLATFTFQALPVALVEMLWYVARQFNSVFICGIYVLTDYVTDAFISMDLTVIMIDNVHIGAICSGPYRRSWFCLCMLSIFSRLEKWCIVLCVLFQLFPERAVWVLDLVSTGRLSLHAVFRLLYFNRVWCLTSCQ